MQNMKFNNQITLKDCVIISEEEKTRQIQILLLKGFSAVDLSDSRIFNTPFDLNDIFDAICDLNFKKAEVII